MGTAQEQAQEVTAKELAERLEVEPKELRKWLRAEGLGVGPGGKRYAFTPEKAKQVARKFKAAHKEEADAS